MALASELTAEDKALLETGELVTKEKSEDRGQLQLFGGQSWQVLDVPVDVAWKTVGDLSNYKEIVPVATESKVQRQKGNEAEVAIRQQKGLIDIRYLLRTKLDDDRRVMIFRMDPSRSDLRAGWGFVRVRPWKGNKTLMSFGALVDIGDGVFVSLIRPSVRKHLLRMPTRFKKFVEKDRGVTNE